MADLGGNIPQSTMNEPKLSIQTQCKDAELGPNDDFKPPMLAIDETIKAFAPDNGNCLMSLSSEKNPKRKLFGNENHFNYE